MKQKFTSKVDWWYYLVVISIPVVVVVPALMSASSEDDVPSFIACLFALALPLWLLVSTDYTIEGRALKIRSGPFKWQVSLDDIHKVEETRSVISSPALSLERIKIDYGQGKTVIVSPKDKHGFMEAVRGKDD